MKTARTFERVREICVEIGQTAVEIAAKLVLIDRAPTLALPNRRVIKIEIERVQVFIEKPRRLAMRHQLEN